MIAAAAKGFHLVNHSNCENCEKEEAWSWIRAQGRTIPKLLCWTLHAKTRYGDYVLPFNCKYSDITRQECELDFSKTDIRDKIKCKVQLSLGYDLISKYFADTMTYMIYFIPRGRSIRHHTHGQ